MDAEAAALATAAATALVKALGTDVWRSARDGVAALWRKARSNRADRVEQDLADDRDRLIELSAETSADSERVQALHAALVEEWRGRLTALLALDPGLVADLRTLLAERLADPQGGTTAVGGSIEQHATASRRGTVIQAGGAISIGGSVHPPDE